MLEWNVPLIINGAWRVTKIVSRHGNKYQAVADYRAEHPEVTGADYGQAWSRWL